MCRTNYWLCKRQRPLQLFLQRHISCSCINTYEQRTTTCARNECLTYTINHKNTHDLCDNFWKCGSILIFCHEPIAIRDEKLFYNAVPHLKSFAALPCEILMFNCINLRKVTILKVCKSVYLEKILIRDVNMFSTKSLSNGATINDLGWPWTADTHSVPEKMGLSEPTTKKKNGDRPTIIGSKKVGHWLLFLAT